MKTLSQRSVFTGLMSALATLYGCVAAVIRLGGQTDIIADVAKIAGVIAIGTAVLSFVFWTVLYSRNKEIWRGGLAGFLTAILIIPLPFFASTFKAEFFLGLKSGGAGLIEAFIMALLPATKSGLLTFIDISKLSLIAAFGSIGVGLIVAYYMQPNGPSAKAVRARK